MDLAGPEECESRIDEFVTELVKRSEKVPELKRLPRFVRATAARRMIRVAIRKATRRRMRQGLTMANPGHWAAGPSEGVPLRGPAR